MRLRAYVKSSTGKAVHATGTIINGVPVMDTILPTPAYLEISDEEGGMLLQHFDSTGAFQSDTWHRTLHEAMSQAEFEFGISTDEWTAVNDE